MTKEAHSCPCCKFVEWFKTKKKQPAFMATWLLFILALMPLICGFIMPGKDFFTCAAVLIAAVAITFQAHLNELEKNQKTSQFYLKNYIQATELILKRLNDDSPTRHIAWVSAASIAIKVKVIEGKITEPVDKEYLEIYQRDLAHIVNEFFLNRSSAYFYGANEKKDIEVAYDECGLNQIPGSNSLVASFPRVIYIDEDSIKKVLELTKSVWEKEGSLIYKNDSEFDNCIKFNYPELYRYLIHLREKKENKKIRIDNRILQPQSN